MCGFQFVSIPLVMTVSYFMLAFAQTKLEKYIRGERLEEKKKKTGRKCWRISWGWSPKNKPSHPKGRFLYIGPLWLLNIKTIRDSKL